MIASLPRRSFLAVALAPLLLAAGVTRPAPGARREDPPRVLIVSPDTGGIAQEFAGLLRDHEIPVTVATWEEATVERARAFDLVLVTGPGRRVEKGRVVTDYDRPVLGIGPYGCNYFGLLRLKNGHPYT